MYITYNYKKIRNFSIAFHAFLIVLTPLLYWILNQPFDTRFWVVYIIFIILLPAVSIYFWNKMAGSEKLYIEEKLSLVKAFKRDEFNKKIQHICKKKGWRIKQTIDDYYLIETPVSWKSFGEIITLRLDYPEIHMSSRPKVTPTRMDYGRNRQNLEYMVRELS